MGHPLKRPRLSEIGGNILVLMLSQGDQAQHTRWMHGEIKRFNYRQVRGSAQSLMQNGYLSRIGTGIYRITDAGRDRAKEWIEEQIEAQDRAKEQAKEQETSDPDPDFGLRLVLKTAAKPMPVLEIEDVEHPPHAILLAEVRAVCPSCDWTETAPGDHQDSVDRINQAWEAHNREQHLSPWMQYQWSLGPSELDVLGSHGFALAKVLSKSGARIMVNAHNTCLQALEYELKN